MRVDLKGQVSRDFYPRFFHQITSPGPIGMPRNIFFIIFTEVFVFISTSPAKYTRGLTKIPKVRQFFSNINLMSLGS
jgi:hypothetical protein